MGRPLKITPLEVLERIKENERTTKDELAEDLGICKATVGNRLKDLRDDGEPVLFDEEGLFFFDGIENVSNIETLGKYRDWVIKTLIGVARCSKPVRPITVEYRNKFKELTTREERVAFSKFFLAMGKFVEYLVIDDDEEE